MTVALLTCLEALLGVINACLPVMKPVFSNLRASSIVSSFRTRKTAVNSDKSIKTPPLNRKHSSRGGGNCPHISRPRQTVHKNSLLMYPSKLTTDVRAPSIPLPSFSWQSLSRFDLPRAEWGYEHGPSGITKFRIDSDIGHRPSEGDSPILPWPPQWRSHYPEAIDRC